MKIDDVYYDTGHAEILHHNSRYEAIEAILESEPSPMPKEIELVKYVRRKITDDPKVEADNILNALLETLDEEYAHEDLTEKSDEMIKASNEFVKKIYDLYVPWVCKIVSTENINVKEWVIENNPNWIKDGVTFEVDDA